MAAINVYDAHPLFEDVQLNHVFKDGKTFVDCLPKSEIEAINQEYIHHKKTRPAADLKEFILQHFELPTPHSENYASNMTKTVEENIDSLWEVLTRQPDKNEGSLIALPFPYIVPGGRFGEIYYWDSYFTMLGLLASGKHEMIDNMVKNFSFLIEKLGYIPNGNRNYFIGRSQPPFYSLMVKMLQEIKGDHVLADHLSHLVKEYNFWMAGTVIDTIDRANERTVKMSSEEILNRYWDSNNSPRPESYSEDVALAKESESEPEKLYRHLRAGAESGWDFSSRWFKNNKFADIHTTDIIPVDLNCLLLHCEQTIAEAYRLRNDITNEEKYQDLAARRKASIEKYCWNENAGFYFDYDFVAGAQKTSMTLAGAFPLYFNVATKEQAASVAAIINDKFLQPGGLITTLEVTGQQWDAPNGWAPLHWIVINGLENYGHGALAKEIATRWLRLNTEVFSRTGKLMEKYDVVNTHLEAGGGEYAGQDGFGWTNGVYLALKGMYGVG